MEEMHHRGSWCFLTSHVGVLAYMALSQRNHCNLLEVFLCTWVEHILHISHVNVSISHIAFYQIVNFDICC